MKHVFKQLKNIKITRKLNYFALNDNKNAMYQNMQGTNKAMIRKIHLNPHKHLLEKKSTFPRKKTHVRPQGNS